MLLPACALPQVKANNHALCTCNEWCIQRMTCKALTAATALVKTGCKACLKACYCLQDKASAYILDLRDNSGGVVGSGYNIAQLFLRDGDGFCIVRFGTGEEEIVNMQDSSHVVTQPTVSPLQRFREFCVCLHSRMVLCCLRHWHVFPEP